MSSEQYQPNREVGSGGPVSPANPPPAPPAPPAPGTLQAECSGHIKSCVCVWDAECPIEGHICNTAVTAIEPAGGMQRAGVAQCIRVSDLKNGL